MHCALYGDCAIILTREIVNPVMHCAQQKKVSLILDRESQSYLSWFIVSLLLSMRIEGRRLYQFWSSRIDRHIS